MAHDDTAFRNAAVNNNSKSIHQSLVDLLINVKNQGYKFTTVTPNTHKHVLSKAKGRGKNLRDIFGWNLPFSIDVLCPMLKQLMLNADAVEEGAHSVRSRVRISSLGSDLFLHSCFPTEEKEAVFFGPDTYRFVRFIRQALEKNQLCALVDNEAHKQFRILDIGCGTGAGGIAAVRALPNGVPFELAMNDINPAALDLMAVNAEVAEIPVRRIGVDVLDGLAEEFDLIIANPPYMQDETGRAYRDGGSQLGLELSLRMFKWAFEHLSPSGQLIFYTGVAMTSHSDPFLSIIKPLLAQSNCDWSYEEIDPDVFGEELTKPAYADVLRIAVVGLTVRRRPFVN